ncbi:phosphate/phosphite/phosphonate ABC transporter substrate-binding protein [Oenococcus sicerae]|uniref:Phosphate/phosphite/phosphonate ABC transporter substrate-binding protein n=1 Tax=Oenococcus sicerae TaxID=2203724 RepID=A0AAJ1VNS0_9LACO|nr:phosphate/phosphite/phosphonate ABC transporter substrate-binding protein [Oenococcus sicerae]MDN6900114.1 phosphate/phosphite/phosphonate ABC transporter substrate-binding protein [Oenococcus sicerae]QAS69723.1 phosphate/phosphite/phosphonate ABC transporter substrate-binding protein [Oenococcus sicerae]
MKKFAHSAAVFAIISSVVATTAPIAANAAQPANPKTIRVGFVPSSNATTMEARAKPLGKMLSKQLGQKVVVTVSTDYNSIVEALGSGKIDVGFLPPDGYVQAHKQYGAKVLLQTVRNGVNNDGSLQKKMVNWYRALIIVRKDSKVKSVKDLKGKNIAVQDVTSSSGYIFPIYYLQKKGINVVKNSNLVTVKGHDQGVLAVENKQADAAFIFQDARNLVKADVPNVFKDTKILAETMKIPNDTVTARKTLSKKLDTKIQTAFIKIAKTKKGEKLVENLYDIAGFSKSKDANFKIVRTADKAVVGK